MYQINILYNLKLPNVICQLYLSSAGKKLKVKQKMKASVFFTSKHFSMNIINYTSIFVYGSFSNFFWGKIDIK